MGLAKLGLAGLPGQAERPGREDADKLPAAPLRAVAAHREAAAARRLRRAASRSPEK